MATWCAYLLRCGDGSLYAGATPDLARRLAAHQAGRGARYTRSRLPVALAWHSPPLDRSGALRLEHRLKRLRRSAKLQLAGGMAEPRMRVEALLLHPPPPVRPTSGGPAEGSPENSFTLAIISD